MLNVEIARAIRDCLDSEELFLEDESAAKLSVKLTQTVAEIIDPHLEKLVRVANRVPYGSISPEDRGWLDQLREEYGT